MLCYIELYRGRTVHILRQIYRRQSAPTKAQLLAQKFLYYSNIDSTTPFKILHEILRANTSSRLIGWIVYDKDLIG